MRKISGVSLAVLLFLILSLSVSAGHSSNKAEATNPARVLSALDTLRLNSVASPQLSPDGECVLFTFAQKDMQDKDYKSSTQIWRVGVDGSSRQAMTYAEQNSTSPAWFPSGKLFAFLRSSEQKKSSSENNSNSGAKTQVFFMRVDGGEAWAATSHNENIQSFEISRDGKKLLFTARDALTKEEKEKEKRKDDAELVDQEFRLSHLWIFDIAEKKAQRLTEGDFTVSDAHWSPDGKKIVYVTRINPKVDAGHTADVWVADVATASTRKLYENPGPDTSPRWSPDGKTIAFASNDYPDSSTLHSDLYLIPADGGRPKVLLADFDLPFGSPIWAPDGKTIYWSTGNKTTVDLFAVDINTEDVQRLDTLRGSNRSWELSQDGTRWVWSHTAPSWPGELYTAASDLNDPVRLTEANPWLKEEQYQLAQMKVVSWKNGDGQTIEGVLTLPVGYEEGKKYPFILHPHGGPSGAVTTAFSSTNQFLAGNGFMILQPNFRGSSNYGQEFLNANRNQWGFRDYDDCMTGVDHCIAQGWADAERMICYGWSYGGYMSFWIVTQTDRFQAVSPGAGLPNLYSMYSTTDIPRYLKWYFGTPWDNPEVYEKHSPIRYVKQVKSPVLILHGGSDARVPYTQAVEFYQALKDLGKDVTFVRFPREGHGIREPYHQLSRLRHYLHFFCEHVGLEPVTDNDQKE